MKLVHTVPETCTDTYDQNCAVWLVGCVWKFLVPTCTELCYIRCKFLIQLYKLLVQVSWAGVISIRLGMKFNIIQVNTHRMTESDIRFDVTLSCNDLYMSAHAAPARRLYSSIRQFLIHSTFLLVDSVCLRPLRVIAFIHRPGVRRKFPTWGRTASYFFIVFHRLVWLCYFQPSYDVSRIWSQTVF